MNKTGIFYSFSTKNSATVAEKIKELFGENKIDTIGIDEMTNEQFLLLTVCVVHLEFVQ